MKRKSLKILLVILIIGIIIPIIFSVTQNDNNISDEIKIESQLLIPKLLKLITIYQSYSKYIDGTIVVGTHTLFNIKLQEIIYKPVIDETGSSVKINYPLFGQ